MYQLLADVFYFFCRDSCPNTAGFNYSVFKHHSSCSNNTVAANMGIIHHNGTHAHQHIIIYNAAMYNCIVSDANIISDGGARFLVSAVDYGTILHVYLVAHADKINVATQYGIEPYTALVTHCYFANNGGVGGNKTIFAKFWHHIFNRKNYRHMFNFFLNRTLEFLLDCSGVALFNCKSLFHNSASINTVSFAI